MCAAKVCSVKIVEKCVAAAIAIGAQGFSTFTSYVVRLDWVGRTHNLGVIPEIPISRL